MIYLFKSKSLALGTIKAFMFSSEGNTNICSNSWTEREFLLGSATSIRG